MNIKTISLVFTLGLILSTFTVIANDEMEFDEIQGLNPVIIHLHHDIYVIAYTGENNNGFLKTVRIDSDGTISDDYIDILKLDTEQCFNPDILKINDNIIAIVYSNINSQGIIQTININEDGEITQKPISIITFNYFQVKDPDIIHLQDDFYGIVYGDRGILQIISIEQTGQIQKYSYFDRYLLYDFAPGQGKTPNIVNVYDDIYAITYSGNGNDGYLVTIRIDFDYGSGIQSIDTYEFDSVRGINPSIIKAHDNIFIIAYSKDNDIGNLKTFFISRNGNIVYMDTKEYDSNVGLYPDLIKLNEKIFGIVYSDSEDNGVIKTFSVDEKGDITDEFFDSYTFDLYQGINPDIISISQEFYAIAYTGINDKGILKTIQIKDNGNIIEDIIYYDLEINVNGIGTTDPLPGIYTYESGKKIILEAKSTDSCHVFSHWSGDINSIENPINIMMENDISIIANFAPIDYNLDISIIGNGTTIPAAGENSYECGNIIKISADPNPGWIFDHWDDDLVGNENPTTITMDSDKSVVAYFVQEQYGLSYSLSGLGNGTVEVSEIGPYYHGDTIKIWANASIGSNFNSWNGDLSGSNSPETIVFDSDKSVEAVFDLIDYTVNINSIGSGTVTKTPEKLYYNYGDSVTIQAYPDAGWTFTGWSDDHSGDQNPDIIIITGNIDINAIFTESCYNLNININGCGTVIKNPDYSCYSYGTDVALTALADNGWVFDYWSGDVSSMIETISVSMNENKSVIAHFIQEEYNLTINTIGNGSGSVTVSNPGPYHYGDIINIWANPSLGSRFDSWNGDLSGSNSTETIVFDSDKNIFTIFELINYSINIDIIGSGSVTKNPDIPIYYYGDIVDIQAIPVSGWTFNGWSGDHLGVTNPDTIIITEDMSINALFTEDPIYYDLTLNIVGNGGTNPTVGTHNYLANSVVNIEAIADENWLFENWSGDITESNNQTTIVMDSNKSITASFIEFIIIDNEPPSNISGLSVNDAKDGKLDLNWDIAIDNVAVDCYEIHRDGIIVTNETNNYYQDTGLTNGQAYSYQIRAVDLSGNKGNLSDIVQGKPTKSDSSSDPGPGPSPGPNPSPLPDPTPLQNEPPVAITNGPYFAFIDEKITLNGSKSYDPDNNITSWAWEIGDIIIKEGIVTNHTFSSSGYYKITLTVTDEEGAKNTTETYADIKQPNNPPDKPLLSISEEYSYGKKDNPFVLQITIDDKDGDSIELLIDWGDNINYISEYMTNGTTINIGHSWDAEGLYTISIQAFDINNMCSDILYHTMYIDIHPVHEIGFLIDEDSNDIYDKFKNINEEITISKRNEKDEYLIDNDADNNWDYTYDITNDRLNDYIEEIDSTSKEKINIFLIIGTFIFLLLTMLLFLFLALKKRNYIVKNPLSTDIIIKDILITGDTSHTGPRLVSHLSKRYETIGIDLKETNPFEKEIINSNEDKNIIIKNKSRSIKTETITKKKNPTNKKTTSKKKASSKSKKQSSKKKNINKKQHKSKSNKKTTKRKQK